MALKKGDQLIALHNFKGEKPEDLRLVKGDKLSVDQILSDPNWVVCINSDGKSGVVPVNRVKIYRWIYINERWFHGKISRVQSNSRLMLSDNGTFLIRCSDKFIGDFTLCVKYGRVFFYHIFYTEKGFSLDVEIWFGSLMELVTHYQQNPSGLCCSLMKICEIPRIKVELDDDNVLIIDLVEIEIGIKLDGGEFAEVFKGKFDHKMVALKCFNIPRNSAEKTLLKIESLMMSKIQHPNIVKFIGKSISVDKVYIITEFMENGSLVNYLRSRGRRIIRTTHQIKFAYDICLGMCYLEKHCLVHRDLAARNILLNEDLIAKVSDFGLAKVDDNRTICEICLNIIPLVTNTNSASHVCSKTPSSRRMFNINDLRSLVANISDDKSSGFNKIPVKWTAPEGLVSNKFTNKSDVWSFGILLWEIFTYGRTPYPKFYTNAVKEHVLDGYRMESPEETPSNMYNLMLNCWVAQPERRPTFYEIKKMLQSERVSLP